MHLTLEELNRKKVGVCRADALNHNHCIILVWNRGAKSRKSPASGSLMQIPIGIHGARASPCSQGLNVLRWVSGQGKRPKCSRKLRGVENELSIPSNRNTMPACVYVTPSWAREGSSGRRGMGRGTDFKSTPRQ